MRGPARRSSLLFAGVATVVLAAACDGAGEPSTAADTDDLDVEVADDDPDDEASATSDPDPDDVPTDVLAELEAGPLRATLTRLPDEVSDLTGAEPAEALFEPTGIDVVGTRFHAVGQLATPDGPALPAIYRSPLEDGASWTPIELELADDVVAGDIAFVDDPDVTVLHLRDAGHRSFVELRRRTADPRTIAVIDDADVVQVHNVAADGEGYVAVGSRRDDGVQRPAVWSIEDGSVSVVELPDDPRLDADAVQLDAVVSVDGRLQIAGHDEDTSELVWLEGDSVDELEVVDTPDGLDGALQIHTMLLDRGTVWLGGRMSGVVGGEFAIWSGQAGGQGFRDRTAEVWEDRGSFTSAARRLTAGRFPSGDEYVAVVDGDATRWWITSSGEVTETGHLGGTLVAYSPVGEGSVVSLHTGTDHWRIGFEEDEVDLPPTRAGGIGPRIISAADGLVSVFEERFEGQLEDEGDTTVSRVVELGTGRLVGEAEGALQFHPSPGLGILTGGNTIRDRQPAAVRIDDGELVPIDLMPEDEEADDADDPDAIPVTVRTSGALRADGESLIVGHHYPDQELRPIAWELDGAEATRTDRFDEVLGQRGFTSVCGPTTAMTFDVRLRLGVSWPLAEGGPIDIQPDLDMLAATSGFCIEDATGDVWLLSTGQLIRVAPDGSLEEFTVPELRVPVGVQEMVLAGEPHLVAIVGDEVTESGNRLWVAPREDPTSASVSEAFHLPTAIDMRSTVGFDADSARTVIAIEVGTTQELYALDVEER